ncbi:hypothetical protein [Heyndrickxia camelliae]|uniref:Uncharacterized protein n=1 Tax=Heyndrickxia camelliae TaxID=1707093 RepID=A0A2N3LCU2_9BACI|nr:hypothetical protein [Heyndrickxia camelliae]PKR82448.1 hypothetical protein CWO92_24405 [Heyndrickxia camelliae]
MYLFYTKREKKITYISLLINSVIFTIIAYYLFELKNDLFLLIKLGILLFSCQIISLIMPDFTKKFFFKTLHPKDDIDELQKKLKMIEEEIKKVKGLDYYDDASYK